MTFYCLLPLVTLDLILQRRDFSFQYGGNLFQHVILWSNALLVRSHPERFIEFSPNVDLDAQPVIVAVPLHDLRDSPYKHFAVIAQHGMVWSSYR